MFNEKLCKNIDLFLTTLYGIIILIGIILSFILYRDFNALMNNSLSYNTRLIITQLLSISFISLSKLTLYFFITFLLITIIVLSIFFIIYIIFYKKYNKTHDIKYLHTNLIIKLVLNTLIFLGLLLLMFNNVNVLLLLLIILVIEIILIQSVYVLKRG